jgi:hypothetical protein
LLLAVRGFLLLGFLVIRVLAARIAKLGELETSRGGLLVLGGGIVPVLAHRALQGNDLAHLSLLLSLASHPGWQAAHQVFKTKPLTRRDAG